MKYLGLALLVAAVQVSAHYHEGPPPPPPPPPLSPLEQEALQKVEAVCQRDVERLCRPPEEALENPIMQWMMAPERLAPPMIHPDAVEPTDPINLGPLLDHMMDAALRMPMIMQPQEPVFYLIFETQQDESVPAAPEERALDSMVSRLVQHTDCGKKNQEGEVSSEETHDITHHIRLKGQEIMEQEGVPDDRRRLARRLTEVTPEEIMMNQQYHSWHHHEQHICPRKAKCLMQARAQNKLVPDCAEAVSRLEVVHESEMQKRHEMDLYMSFFWLYCVLFFSLFTMIFIRKFRNERGLFPLKLRILQAVYSNPEIKAKVEDEVGIPLGSVPPLSSVGLKLLSAEGRQQLLLKRERFLTGIYVLFGLLLLDSLGYMPPSWPLVVMGLCCALMFYRIVSFCCSKPEVRECQCCCCGGTTTDAENGTVSDAHACCTCCKGSGICAVKCRTCCGTASDKDGGGCCGGSCSCSSDHDCDGSCGCCGDSNNKSCPTRKVIVGPKTIVYQGVPMQVV